MLLTLIFLFWLITNFVAYIPGSFESGFGIKQPENRVYIKEHLFALCSINPFDFCNLQYRFSQIDEARLDTVTSQMKKVGFSDWQDGKEIFIGNYGNGRNDISRTGMLASDKEVNGRLHLWLVYYPSIQSIDFVEFRH